MNIFGKGFGAVSKEPMGKRKAFITFVGESAGAKLSEVLFASAPVTGVKITQTVDYSITKALDKDFLIAAFGDQPVSIVLEGLSIYATSPDNYTPDADALPNFYKEYRISKNQDSRVKVGIAGLNSGGAAFTCAVVGLEMSASSSTISSGLGSYKLILIGVEI